MKNLIFSCAFILCLSVFGGCSKDDGPSAGAKVDGSVKVDGKKINLKYGYVAYASDYDEYFFYDIDVMKYADVDFDELDVEYSGLYVSYDNDISNVDEISIDYKINNYEETGSFYTYDGYDAYKYISFSNKSGKVKCSSKSISVDGYSFNGTYIDSFDASFSVDGKVKDVTDIRDVGDYTRGIEVVEVTDPKQASFLRSLGKKHRNVIREK